MEATGRPVAPHVTIYSFPISAIASITNRATGVILSLGCAGLGFVEIFGGSGMALDLTQTIGGAGALVAAGAKFSVAFPLVFHYGGAIRHLAWDTKPDYLNNVDVEKTSYALLGGSLALSTGLMFL
jgi:succinate dehydrogenase (ubiquinone) cytochrome b560 subunit